MTPVTQIISTELAGLLALVGSMRSGDRLVVEVKNSAPRSGMLWFPNSSTTSATTFLTSAPLACEDYSAVLVIPFIRNSAVSPKAQYKCQWSIDGETWFDDFMYQAGSSPIAGQATIFAATPLATVDIPETFQYNNPIIGGTFFLDIKASWFRLCLRTPSGVLTGVDGGFFYQLRAGNIRFGL